MVQGGGFEPPKLARQIYSLIPLATREPHLERAKHSAYAAITCQFFILQAMNSTALRKVELARGVEPPTG